MSRNAPVRSWPIVSTCLLGLAIPSARGLFASPADTNAGDRESVALTSGMAEFASGLYQQARQQHGNFLFSPYSISEALAMTYAGARNRTEQQMAATLRFSLNQQRLHVAFKNLHQQLMSRGESTKGQDGGAFRLHIANALWSEKSYRFLPTFMEVLSDHYGTALQHVDFRWRADTSRIIINDWVTNQTEGRIKNLFPPDSITKDTRLVLANAIYFNAAWQSPFLKGATRDDDFNLLSGDKIRIPTMSQTTSLGYVEVNGIRVVGLSYDGGQLSMVVFSPRTGWLNSISGSLSDLEDSLTAEWLTSFMPSLRSTKVRLTMPKFKYESQFNLNPILEKLGMTDAFDPDDADFSGMTGQRDLKIDLVVHKTFILVDESGTEAAAATGVAMGHTTSIRKEEEPIIVRIDSPFVYLIRDNKTGAILFMGRVTDPR